MGRNSHNKIRNRNFKNGKFNIEEIRKMVSEIQKSENAIIVLNGVLFIFPWAVLFACGAIK